MRFDEWAIKTALSVVSIWIFIETTAYAVEPDPIAIGKRAETLGIVGILAAVIVVLAIALVLVYRGKEEASRRREERLEKLVELTATNIAEDSETRREQSAILLEFKRVIEKCQAK